MRDNVSTDYIFGCVFSFSGLKLFGKSYSGLEYDYRGLLNVYTKLDEYEKVLEYTYTFNNWRELRDHHAQCDDPPIDLKQRPQPIRELIQAVFSL